MKWSIITDSSCDSHGDMPELAGVHFAKVPFIINVGGEEFIDDENLDVSRMLDCMERSRRAGSTACPSPFAWCDQFEQADRSIAITISSNLSGSYNSAMAARDMVLEDYPEKEIFVLDSRSAGSALTMYAHRAAELVRQGLDFSKITDRLQSYVSQCHTIFALSSFGNLVKNGRMSRLAGFVAGKLGFWGIGVGSREGRIEVKGRAQNVAHVISGIIEDMKEHLFASGDVVISHCQNPELAHRLRSAIMENWAQAKVRILSTGGLCSFYAERKGLIVSY